MSDVIIAAVLLAGLAAASAMDVKERRVPLPYFPLLIALVFLLGLVLPGAVLWQERLVTGGVLFLILFGAMHYGNLGGADVLAGASIGAGLGFRGLTAVLLSFLFVLPYTIYMKVTHTEHEYPFIPFMLAGTAASLLTCLWY